MRESGVFFSFFVMCLVLSDVSKLAIHAAEKFPGAGHRKPLGSHTKPYGVTAIGKFSSPQVFYGHFVKASKPIHMKSALTETKHPGMDWTDEFLRDHYGSEMVHVEVGKNEVRDRKGLWMRFKDFLDDYPHKDLYMVHSIKGPLEDLVRIPSTLMCGGFERSVLEAVMWMGQGPLRSVLHYDELDNLLCVFDGTKDVILFDKFYKNKIESRGFVKEGRYSKVDPESVDMYTFPQFQSLPWYRVHLAPGDCVYIPYGWYHQVSTYGDRSLAINIWFSHIWWFDDDSCEDFSSFPHHKPLRDFGGFSSSNEALRSRWLEKFEGTDDDVELKDFSERVSGTEEHIKKAFSLIDKDEDGVLSWEELSLFDISKGLLQYPSVFISDSTEKETISETKPDDSAVSENDQYSSESETVVSNTEESTDKELNQGPSEHRHVEHEEL